MGSTESFVAPLAALPHGGGAARDLIGRVLGSLDDGVLDLPRGVTALSIFALHVVTWHAGALFFAWLDRSKIADKYKFTRCGRECCFCQCSRAYMAGGPAAAPTSIR